MNRLPSGMTEDSLYEYVNLSVIILLSEFWYHNNNICNCIELDEKF